MPNRDFNLLAQSIEKFNDDEMLTDAPELFYFSFLDKTHQGLSTCWQFLDLENGDYTSFAHEDLQEEFKNIMMYIQKDYRNNSSRIKGFCNKALLSGYKTFEDLEPITKTQGELIRAIFLSYMSAGVKDLYILSLSRRQVLGDDNVTPLRPNPLAAGQKPR